MSLHNKFNFFSDLHIHNSFLNLDVARIQKLHKCIYNNSRRVIKCYVTFPEVKTYAKLQKVIPVIKFPAR